MEVHDPFGARHDPELPSLALALDPSETKRRLKRRLPRLAGADGVVRVRRARVTRYKPRRRCVVEYDLRVVRPDADPSKPTVVGKVRARRYGKEGFELLERLWRAGFSDGNPDAILVPEPLATLADLRMWLQRKAPGRAATDLLAEPEGPLLAARIAEATHKLHRAGVQTSKRHTLADELRILRSCLWRAAELRPDLSGRIIRVLATCERHAAGVGECSVPVGSIATSTPTR